METTSYERSPLPKPHRGSGQPVDVSQKTRRCNSTLCSIGLIKAGCPTCLLLGLVMMPFEWAGRAIAGRLAGHTSPTDPMSGDHQRGAGQSHPQRR